MENNNDNLIPDHEYDGIRELDNPLPTWWLAVFFVTIIFGFHYWLYYTIGEPQAHVQELAADLQEINSRKKNVQGPLESEETLSALLASNEARSKGQAVFAAKCAVCHGAELQGLIGPNLTDDFWISGKGKLVDIAAVVRAGVPDKGMPAWKDQLPADELQAVTVFIKSQVGSNPANPKAPQGEKVVN